MKKGYIVVLVLLILVIIFVFLILKFKQNNKTVVVSNIERLNFSYTQGYMVNSDVRYELECKEECILLYKPYGVSYDDAKKYKVDDNIILEIESLLNKYEVSNWNGFHGNDKNVLDGDSFGFYVYMKNGDRIESSGYMKWPNNYGKVKSELESIFDKAINSKKVFDK